MSKTVEIERPDGEVSFTLVENDFTIDPTHVDAELCNMGRTMLEYGDLETELRLEVERKEAALDKLHYDLDESKRHNAAMAGDKLTEAKLKVAITGHPQRIDMLESISKSKKNHNMMKWVMQALQAKRDCLIALSYRERQLMKADQY